MVNLIIGSGSESGKKEFCEGDIGTSRNSIQYIIDGEKYSIEPGIDLKNEKSTNEGISRIIEAIEKVLATKENLENERIIFTSHAMNSGEGLMDIDYTSRIIRAIQEKIDHDPEVSDALKSTRNKIDALLISFDKESNTFYGAREIKNNIEDLVLTGAADRKKIIDLEGFESQNAKAMGFIFILVAGQFIELLESDTQSPLSLKFRDKIQLFLGDDYTKIIELFTQYPRSGKVGEGQLSMDELGKSGELDAVINDLASEINFAKLSHISKAISEIYIDLAMSYLRKFKEEILDSQGDRFLLDWEKIIKMLDENIVDTQNNENENFNQLFQELENSLKYHDYSDQYPIKGLFAEVSKNIEFGPRITQKQEVSYIFNTTEENFEIMGDHFGVDPIIMLEGLILDSGLLQKHELNGIIRARNPMYISANITLKREDKNGKTKIYIFDSDNPGQDYAEFEVEKAKIIKTDSQGPETEEQYEKRIKKEKLEEEKKSKQFILPTKEITYDSYSVPHRKGWIEMFSGSKIPDLMGINSRSLVSEMVGIKIANTFFIDPDKEDLDLLKKMMGEDKYKIFNDQKKGFKCMYMSIKRSCCEDFKNKIKGTDIDIKVLNTRHRTSPKPNNSGTFEVGIEVSDRKTKEVLSTQLCIFV